MPALIVLERCPLCGGQPVPHLQETYDCHYGIDGLWNYQRCQSCSVVFLNPAPSEKFLTDSYDDTYYSYQDFRPATAWKTWLRRAIGYNHGTTGDPVFDRPGRVLDIGCGSGAFLYRMQAAGWETRGVDISAKAAAVGNSKHLNIHAGTLASAALPPAHFDYVRLNHSFEHVVDPKQTLALVAQCLAPDGLLFIGVPNVAAWQARVFGKYWWHLCPPVHPYQYSRRSISRLLEEQGFEVVSCRTHSNFAGIVGSLQMALNGRKGLRSDTGRLFTNPIAKVMAHWLARLSDLPAAGDCLEIVARKRALEAPSHG